MALKAWPTRMISRMGFGFGHSLGSGLVFRPDSGRMAAAWLDSANPFSALLFSGVHSQTLPHLNPCHNPKVPPCKPPHSPSQSGGSLQAKAGRPAGHGLCANLSLRNRAFKASMNGGPSTKQKPSQNARATACLCSAVAPLIHSMMCLASDST